MTTPSPNIEEIQKSFCQTRGIKYLSCPPECNLGFALSTEGKVPINGLRHPPQGDTCGWYIWCGEEFSESPEFFSPVHVKHIYEDNAEIARLLGMVAGYRFLLAGSYLDVWYDESLLHV
jgi:hypothetical protein